MPYARIGKVKPSFTDKKKGAVKTRDYTQYICFKCGEKGHIQLRCPNADSRDEKLNEAEEIVQLTARLACLNKQGKIFVVECSQTMVGTLAHVGDIISIPTVKIETAMDSFYLSANFGIT